ncbi:MAG TPA: hypothetical protein VK982_15495 [Bacteroidales bacterium]|nr:hypothetical protein [Bacteroidales bacterium]
MNIRRKQIAFNLDDPLQKKLYDYVNQTTTNFSSYGKYLIKRDMEGFAESTSDDLEEVVEINKSVIDGFI